MENRLVFYSIYKKNWRASWSVRVKKKTRDRAAALAMLFIGKKGMYLK
jgi:hypothetical protein